MFSCALQLHACLAWLCACGHGGMIVTLPPCTSSVVRFSQSTPRAAAAQELDPISCRRRLLLQKVQSMALAHIIQPLKDASFRSVVCCKSLWRDVESSLVYLAVQVCCMCCRQVMCLQPADHAEPSDAI